MKRPATRLYFGMAAFLAIYGSGCQSGNTCMTGTSSVKAVIVSVAAPAHISVGEQATITVGVRNNSPFCVQEAKADISNNGFDSLLVTAALNITGGMATEDCDCKRDTIIYTLVYFKPLDPGTYRIAIEKDSSVSSAEPNESLGFSITVD